MAEEDNLSLEESGLVLERSNRRARKEEPKLSDVRVFSSIFFVVVVFESDGLNISIFNKFFLCYRVRVLPLPAFQSLKGR